ncbi:MAG: cytochrome c maturation protein CcmE [Candidatus Tectomicrobia bacterium]|uniref:Cytochrome c maturation protein CcmE n=1 Tax=Tectimicrobiota bacterium TaxID=2528274 RepID=A0A932I1E3_UNCTE|nr:cytochrome c maturation protein CcmE [Candidatus Tectomicrobia bacterium]
MTPQRAKFIIAGIVVVSAFLYLAVSGFRSDNFVYFMTVDEAATKAASLNGQGIRVQGKVVPKTITRNPQAMGLAFRLQGEKQTLAVSYRGVPPDLLENGFPVIAEGKLDESGTLVAKNLMVACPSKFEEMKAKGEAIPQEHQKMVERATKE